MGLARAEQRPDATAESPQRAKTSGPAGSAVEWSDAGAEAAALAACGLVSEYAVAGLWTIGLWRQFRHPAGWEWCGYCAGSIEGEAMGRRAVGEPEQCRWQSVAV